MAKFDEQLSRMEYLMSYNMPKNSMPSKVEYFTEGADGKVYGILKEGTKYYIMTTEKGKEKLSESYQYIGGFDHRNENGFNSYNQATKILEQKMIVLNESYGIHKDVSTVDFNRGEKILESLTKDARTELDRVKMIMENSLKVGHPVGDGDPFEEKAEAELDKDFKTTETDPEDANEDYTDASKSVEKELTTGEPSVNTTSMDDFEKAECDLDGVAVAAENPKGGKATMVNEDTLVNDDDIIDTPLEDYEDDVPFEDGAEEETDVEFENEPQNLGTEAEPDALVGFGDEEDDLDTLMEEFKECISGDDDTLTGPHGTEPVQSVECKDGSCKKAEVKQEALDGPKGNGESIATETLSESRKARVNAIADAVTKKIFESKGQKMTISDAIKSVLNENELHVWGDHPNYQKQPMTTPPNTDVKAGTADKDWDDESAKGNAPYGKKKGNAKPFEQTVEILTDSVMAVLKEALGLKKK